MGNLKGVGKIVLGAAAGAAIVALSSSAKKNSNRIIYGRNDAPDVCEDCGERVSWVDSETYICDDCGSYYSLEDGNWVFYSVKEEDCDDEWGSDIPSRPQVCTGCGSDMWPDCQYSCKLFDN